MANVAKRPYAQVYPVAAKLVQRLAPACTRLEIAGSLRRRAEMVGDIEIVAVPILHRDLFGVPTGTSEVDRLLADWPVQMLADGAKQKKFLLTTQRGETYQVDLFLQPDPATWAVNLLIRTGSADFSHWLVTKRALGGAMWDDCASRDARIWYGDQVVSLPEEADLFTFLQLDYFEPTARTEGRWHTLPAGGLPL